MAETSKQQAVVEGRVEVDDRERARTIDGEHIDLAARVTRYLGVDRAQALLERPAPVRRKDGGEPIPGDLQWSQHDGISGGTGGRRGPGRVVARLVRQEQVRDVLQSPSKRTAGYALRI